MEVQAREEARREVAKWAKLDRGYVKINSDAAVIGERRNGVGFVVRDEEGEAMVMGARRIQRTEEVEIAEAEGVLWAIRSSVQMGITHAIVEVDCLPLYDKLGKGVKVRRELGSMLQGIKRAAEELISCRWSCVRRTANRVAHFLDGRRPEGGFIYKFRCQFPLSVDRLV